MRKTSQAKAAEWRGHVEAWRSSGKTAARYCAEQGLTVASLRYWSSRVRKQERGGTAAEAAPKPRAVRLARVQARASKPAPAAPPSPAMWLSVGELTLQVPAGFDRAALREVVSLVLDVVEGRR